MKFVPGGWDPIRRARRSFAALLVLLAALAAGAVFALRDVVLGTVLILILVLVLIVLRIHSVASKYDCVIDRSAQCGPVNDSAALPQKQYARFFSIYPSA